MFAVSVCLSLLVGTGVGSAADRPNILWITCEDMGARLGCYGDDTAATPNLDRLASDPEHFEKLAELREAHQRWTLETGDLGHMPESELIKRLWPPDGEQPVTADPEITIDDGLVTVRCESEGASIAYRVGDGDRWLLYTEPFEVSAGDSVQAQAIRLGWKKSGVTKAER